MGLPARRQVRPAAPDDTGPRSFSIWWLVALFVALAVGGLLVLLFLQTEDESVQLQVPQTLPDPLGPRTPAGVGDVIIDSGTTWYLFEPPEGVDVPDGGAPRDGHAPHVAAAIAFPSPTPRELVLGIGCTVSEDEFPGWIAVTESAAAVQAAAVVLVPPGGAPCPADGEVTEVRVPLASPLGAREVSVAPEGAEVPEPPSG